MCDTDRQFQSLHGAGTGHDRDLLVPDFHAVDVDDRIIFLKFPADELPGRQDREHALDTR